MKRKAFVERQTFRGLTLALVAGSVVAGGLAACADPPPPPVIGVVATRGIVAAAALGFSDAMAAYPSVQLDTVFRIDNAAEVRASLGLAAEILEIPGVLAVIGHANSSASLAAAPLYNAAGVVQLAPSASTPLYSGVGPFSFRMVPSDASQGAELARLAEVEIGQGRRVAILYVNDEYGRGLRSSFLASIAPTALEVVLDLPHAEPETADPDTEVIANFVAASGAELVAFLGRPPVLQQLLPTLRARAGAVPVIGPEALGLIYWNEPSPPGDAWAGVTHLDFTELSGTPEMDAFRTRYLAATGRSGMSSEAVLAYDAARVLVEGLARGARSGSELADWMRELGSSGGIVPGTLAGPVPFDSLGNVRREYRVNRIPFPADPGSRR
jgi:branched-chain amino acid transport system substrate-binding protein